MKPVVVVDCDGVLANFEEFFCERFGTDHRELVGLEKRYPQYKHNIVRFVNSPETYRLLQPLQIGLDIIKYLSHQKVIVHIVTSRPQGTHQATEDWLQYYQIPFSFLSTSPDKVRFIKSIEPVMLVDDIISIADECYPIPAILVAHPWNDTVYYPRIENIVEFQVAYERIMSNLGRKVNGGVSSSIQPK